MPRLSRTTGCGECTRTGRVLSPAEVQEFQTAMDYRAHGDRLLQSALNSDDPERRAVAESILMARVGIAA